MLRAAGPLLLVWRRRAWLLSALLLPGLLLAGCAAARAPSGAPYDATPCPDAWGPHPGAPMEWWYVSGQSAAATPPGQAALAFHAAFFRARVPAEQRLLGVPLAALLPGTYSLASLSVTDLTTGERLLWQHGDLPFGWACAQGPPQHPRLALALGGLRLEELPTPAPGGAPRYGLTAGPLALTLVARTPRVVHPPGFSGGPGLGRLAYQSVPRLSFAGAWRGQPVEGLAWLDHQWGDQVPGRDARWDWHALHLDDGSDVMLYRLTRPDGGGRVLLGSRTRLGGSIEALRGLSLEPCGVWRGAGGRRYATAWRARADGLELQIDPLRPDQETPSLSGVVYWEGPVRVEGTVDGRAVRGTGMGEHLPLPRGGPAAYPCVRSTHQSGSACSTSGASSSARAASSAASAPPAAR